MTEPPIHYVLTGPTASGKKEVGLEVARRLGAEVVAVDSVKVYRGMAIGGAQPDAADTLGVRMHLLGIADPGEPYSVGRWLDDAAQAVASIRSRGAAVLFLGGTAMYLHALLRGFFDGPPSEPETRARLEAEARQSGVAAMHARLAAVDPDSAAWIGERDAKRILRALEVHELAGVPISRLQRERTRRAIEGTFRVAGLTASEALLRARQAARVDRMFERGLIDEVRGLAASGSLVGEAARAIGYREVLDHLAGKTDLAATRDAILHNTWTLTRKQRKWFRRLDEVNWIERTATSSSSALVERVLAVFGTPESATLQR